MVNYLKDIRRAAEVTQHGLGASNGSTLPAAPSAPTAPPNRPKRPIASELTQQLKNFLDTLRSKKEFKIFLTPVRSIYFPFLSP